MRMIKETNKIMRFYSFGQQQHTGGPGNYPCMGAAEDVVAEVFGGFAAAFALRIKGCYA